MLPHRVFKYTYEYRHTNAHITWFLRFILFIHCCTKHTNRLCFHFIFLFVLLLSSLLYSRMLVRFFFSLQKAIFITRKFDFTSRIKKIKYRKILLKNTFDAYRYFLSLCFIINVLSSSFKLKGSIFIYVSDYVYDITSKWAQMITHTSALGSGRSVNLLIMNISFLKNCARKRNVRLFLFNNCFVI